MATSLSLAPEAVAMEAGAVNILIVDDLPEKLLVFQSILEELQQNLILVRSGRDALRQLLEHEFAVVLLDVNMPDIDGFETAAMIRNYKKTAQTPIIFITAFADDIQTVRGYSLGAVDYITTPVVPEILRSKVKVFVDLYRMNRELRLWADEREALARAEAGRMAAEKALHRAAFLSEVSSSLTRSLDSESIVQRLLTVAVPAMADVAAVAMFNDNIAATARDSLSLETLQPGIMALHVVGAPMQALNARQQLCDASTDTIKMMLPSRLLELINEALQAGEVHAQEFDGFLRVHPAITHDMSESIEVRWSIALPLYAGNKIVGALLLAYAAARNYAEGDLALAKEVASRASIALENSFLYREIKNGDRRKNEFLAMLTHELRNPLAPIRNSVHIIEQLQLGDATLDWAAKIIGNQVSHIARIVDDLLDVARIARGKIELRSDVISFSSIVQHSLETARPHIDARNQRLFVDVPTDHLLVRGDAVRLAQVLSNLLNNASKYTGAGGHIWLRAQQINTEVVFSVRDNGVGIAPDLLPDIFELFWQGAQSMDRAQGGLGVGLTLVKQLVELHGGYVQAHSGGAGQGAEFTVRLPLCLTDFEKKDTAQSVTGPLAAQQSRVLIVDDQKSSADSLRLIFEMKSFVAEVAYDGPSALEIATAFRPDVVILDIGLPGMDGFEVAVAMKKLPLRNDILLIALTGYGQREDVQRALSVGFDVHLVKPVDIPHLLSVISERNFA